MSAAAATGRHARSATSNWSRRSVGCTRPTSAPTATARCTWRSDFTYLRCWEGLLFFAFVIDVYSRRIVGWQLTAHMRASLVCDALRMAVCTRPRHGADVKLIHHSARGSQYTGLDFAQVLDDYDVLQSVGSVGNAYDCDNTNAAELGLTRAFD